MSLVAQHLDLPWTEFSYCYQQQMQAALVLAGIELEDAA